MEHRPEDARQCLGDGLAILRDLSDHFHVGIVLCALGELECHVRDFDAARAALAEAEGIAAKLSVVPGSELVRSIGALKRRLGEEAS